MPNHSFPQTFTLRLAAATASALEDLIVQTAQRGGDPDRIVGIRVDVTNLCAQIEWASSVRDAEQIILSRRQALHTPHGTMLSTSIH
jgi:uncharacterized protein YbjQ (UPF0145 family)